MTNRQRLFAVLLTLALFGINLAAFNYLIAGTPARIDLTEERVFSITPATKRIVRSVDEPIRLYGFFSSRTHPKLAPLVPEITDVLEEYRAVSRGKVSVEIIDPGDDDEAEQLAADRFGVQSQPFRLNSKYETGIVNAFFSIVVQYGDQYERYGFIDLIEVEPQADGDIDVRLRNLEYDITRAIKKVVYGFQGANELFARIEQPVRLTALISSDTLPELFADVPDALRTAAADLSEAGGDKFEFQELDPSTDPQGEGQAQAWGLPPLSLGMFDQSSFYLYAVLDVGGKLEQIVLSGENVTAATIRESVEAAMRRHTPGFLKRVGIVAPAPLDLPPQFAAQFPQPPPEFEQLKRFLGQGYEVEDVSLSDPVPATIDTLLVVKPRSLGETEVYNLDQYVMRGGRVILCAGRFDASIGQQGPTANLIETGLEDWLAHVGVELEPTLVLDDQNQPLPIPQMRNTPLGQMVTWDLAYYPYLVQVRDAGFADRDITSRLDSVGIYWGSPVRVVDDETSDPDIEVRPLLQSSESSWTDPRPSGVQLREYVIPDDAERHVLAVSLIGQFDSFFAESGAPAPEAPAEGQPPAAATADLTLERSPETRLVVIGNGAFLSDFVAQSLAQFDGSFFVENLTFIQNVIDWMNLDNDLAAIRSRGLVSRRVERLEESEKNAMEIANYAIPVVALLGFAVWMSYRRRSRTSVAMQASEGGAP